MKPCCQMLPNIYIFPVIHSYDSCYPRESAHMWSRKCGHTTRVSITHCPIQTCLVWWFSGPPMSLSFFLKLSPPSCPIAELTRRLSDQPSFVKASSGVIYSWIHSGGIHLATCRQSARVSASQWGLLQSLQSPDTTPHRSSKSATRLQHGLRFQETSLRSSCAGTRHSIFRRVQTKIQIVIIYSPWCCSKPVSH